MKASTLRPLVVTTCAARKQAPPTLSANQLRRGTQAAVADQWSDALARTTPVLPARDLYAGRGFRIAKTVADTLHADLGIISAGLGYVTGGTRVPSYDLTTTDRQPASIQTHIEGAFDFSQWWQALVRSRYATSFSEDATNRPLIILCLSASYARLFRSELVAAAARPDILPCLRIFGLSLVRYLPGNLHDNVLPYDERLSSVGSSGTRVDFAQRAAADFVGAAAGYGEPLAQAHTKVLARLQSGHLPDKPTRRRLDDERMLEFISAAISRVGPKPTALLHHIRHDAGIACEQSRFRRLFELHQSTRL